MIGAQGADHGLVFKGGTALRLCYFQDYRYSADLDFSLPEGAERATALESVARALTSVAEQIGLSHLALANDGKAIEYEGPLGKRRELKLDIATDELMEETTTRTLLPRYPDQVEAQVTVYTLEEIAAEKLRCVIQRLQARDLFDLNELFVVNEIRSEEVWPAFERKARHKGIDPNRSVSASTSASGTGARDGTRRWRSTSRASQTSSRSRAAVRELFALGSPLDSVPVWGQPGRATPGGQR